MLNSNDAMVSVHRMRAMLLFGILQGEIGFAREEVEVKTLY